MTRRLAGLSFALWMAVAPSAAAQPSPEWIRVAVSRNDPQVTLQVQGHFTMIALHTGSPIHEGRQLHPIAVRAVPEGLALGEEILPIFGVVLTGVGLVLLLTPKLPWIGRLPGDILVQREHVSFYFPLASGLLASVILSVLCWIVGRFK